MKSDVKISAIKRNLSQVISLIWEYAVVPASAS